MTNEEAINCIKANICYKQDPCNDGICKSTENRPCAIDVAIEAVEKQNEIVHCKDCKYWTKGTLEGLNRTLQVPACKLAGWLCAEDGFCMHGEKKEF